MRWKLYVVISVVSIIPCSSMRAETIGKSYRVTHVSQQQPTQSSRQVLSDIVSPALPATKIPESEPRRIRDLFPQAVRDKIGTSSKSNSLSFEPWVPGRGAVGVRLEVTW